MARLLQNIGAEEAGFAARRLTEKLVEDADLVLTLTRAQRSLTVDLWPPAVRHTFTLREFARLLKQIDPFALPAETPAERLRIAKPLAVQGRGLRLTPPEDDDVVDPFGLSDDVFAASFAEITAAVNVIVAAVVLDGS
jgi:protein-tyrosine phosphatase